MTAKAPRPPRMYAAVVGCLGVALAGGGGYLLILGGSAYYVLAGAALLISSWWLWRGDERGSWLYAAIVVATAAWALLEAGLDMVALTPRVGLVAILGLWLALPIARRGLAWKARFRRPSVVVAALIGCGIVAVAAVAAPRVAPPTIADGFADRPAPVAPPRQAEQGATDWTNVGHDLSGNRFVPATQITRANVSRLKLAWSFRTGDMPAEPYNFENSPLEIGDKLYVCTPTRQVIALNAATGALAWRFKPPQDNMKRRFPLNCRGVSYHADPVAAGQARRAACDRRIFVSSFKGELWALDANTGRPCADFGQAGAISLLDGLGGMTERDWVNTSPGTVVGDVIVLGAKVTDEKSVHMPSGVIRAFDVHSGKLAWAWDAGHPDRASAPPPGETYTESTPNAWAAFSADPALSLVYVPTGNPSPDFFGGYRRPFDEKYGTSLVALDTRTGKPRWSFQMVHHDLWDQDLPAQPLLVDWPTASGPRRAVVQLTKTGDIFVLDRATGAPIVPVREKPVPRDGGAPDDRRSPTQPSSALSLAQHDVREADMWGLTPIDQMLCRISYRQSRHKGPYTLPGVSQGLAQSIQSGVNDWSGGTIDPLNQILVTNPRYLDWQYRLVPRPKGDTRILSTSEMKLVEMAGTPYRYTSHPMLSVLSLQCNRPPWGELVGIDMRTGKFAWRRPLGTAARTGPFGVASGLPLAIGTASLGGNVITGGGLSFIAGTPDLYLRAHDVRTGEEVWRASLPAGGNATPVSYVADGRQFVVIAAGGNFYGRTKRGDYVLAYALDEPAAKR